MFVLFAAFGLAACVTPPEISAPVAEIIIPPAPVDPVQPKPIEPPALPTADEDGVYRQRAAFSELPGWESSDATPAFTAFLASCQRMSAPKKPSPVWDEPCTKARGLVREFNDDSQAQIKTFFESEFTPFAMSLPEKNQGLLTAYYEPELQVSRNKTAEFSEPILARPGDLVTVSLRRLDASLPNKKLSGRVKNGQLEPYFTRQEIRQNRGTPLAWGRPTEVFFLQIQGSGRIRYAEGEAARAAFAGHNGQKYHSIGRELISRGELAKGKASKAAIENWINQAGEIAAQELMNTNPRYVFFEKQVIRNPNIGPKGSQGVPLTAKASLAVDPEFHAFGTPIWIDSRLPASGSDWQGVSAQFLAIAQDTGGAIKGALRGDLYYGSGEQAGKLAGIQKHPAKWWTLMPNKQALEREQGA